jgi:predicted metal-dependent hydrolase
VVLALQPPLHVDIVRERRRSITLRILPGPIGNLKIPIGYPDVFVLDFLEQKQQWILRQMDRIKAQEVPLSEYFSGTKIYYLGEPLHLQLSYQDIKRLKLSLMGDKLVLEGPTSMDAALRRDAIYKWLRARAVDILSDRVALYAEKIGKKPTQIRVKSLKSKWGSCSSLGAVNLRWNLIMAPLWVIDYVVVHELCHLYFPHHRPSFWALVSRHCSAYLDAKAWLKNNSMSLELPDIDVIAP